MKRDDIIRKLAELAGWTPTQLEMASEAEWARLERFASIVAAAEREVCAQAAWDIVQYEVHADLADQVAAAIRARSTP